MKQFKKEFLTQHLLVLCAMSIIGALVRNEAMQYGVDTFSCNLTFVISTTILMVVYLHALIVSYDCLPHGLSISFVIQ